MSRTVEDTAAASKPKPTIQVPPRGSMETTLSINWSGPGFSPGPITLMSSFFSDQGPFTFSKLLAMASPVAANDLGKEVKIWNSREDGEISESGVGYKRNRPVNLVVAQPQVQVESQSLSPLFMFLHGLSPSSGLLNSPGFFSPLQSPFGMSHQQALAHVTAQATLSQSYTQMQQQIQRSSAPTLEDNSKIEPPEISQSDKKSGTISVDKPDSDGYNWRKYGQKNVKKSECPRSYYKCTFLDCQVKKKVERSFDGHISEVTYKGQHSHDPPQLNLRGKENRAFDRTIKSQLKTVLAEPENFPATIKQSFENYPVTSHDEEIKDTGIVVCEGNEDERMAKRRNMDTGPSMPSSSQQSVTDSKIVVQTRSEVDLLNDGFKWRKYGQKVVKGNTHPRSYYRCTYAGCDVRKHVERASSDPKSVITTYEGKHNHQIPTRRNNSHGTANATS